MKAIIMAGGAGSRLRPLTCTLPKPMAPVMNIPVMEHIIGLIKKYGIHDIGVTLMYMPQCITDYFGDGSAFGVNLTYFTEESPLGTAGSVKAAEDFIDGDFLVISGDALCDIDLDRAISFHREKSAEATLVLSPRDIPLEYGVVVTGDDGKITRFLEKPVWSQVFSDTVNTGVYVLSKKVLEYIDKTPCDFSSDVFKKMLEEGKPLYGYVADEYWCDIGGLDAYRHCHYDIFDKKVSLDIIRGNEVKKGVYIGENAVIEDGAVINAPAVIGSGAVIKSGAVIDSYSVIGNGSVVKSGTSIKRSIIWKNVTIEENCQIRGAVICDMCIVGRGSNVFEQSVIGTKSVIGKKTTLKPGVKVWPQKRISDGMVLYDNVVWGNQKKENLFGEYGITGSAGTDMLPELGARLGAVFSEVTDGEKIAVSSDGTPPSVMLRLAVTAGLLSGGKRVFDFGDQPVPITRSAIKYYGLDGGVHTSDFSDTDEAQIIFVDKTGANVPAKTERKIEQAINGGDFSRCEHDKINKIEYLYEYKLYYLRELINSVKSSSIGFKILFASESEWAEKFLSSAMNDLGCTSDIIKKDIDFENKNDISDFAKKTVDGKYNFGVALDSGLEKIILSDENGRIIDSDGYKVLAALIIMKQYKNAEIAVPVSASGAVDILADKYGAKIIRTKESPIEVMGCLCEKNAKPEMKEQFVLCFDAVGAIIKIIDFLNAYKISLAELKNEIPEFYMVKNEVDCSFENKGRVMRTLVTEQSEADTSDGIKINSDNGWVLILPDVSRPVFKVISESQREEYADEICVKYSEKIGEILKEK